MAEEADVLNYVVIMAAENNILIQLNIYTLLYILLLFE